jgi:hypothetical protein
LAFYKAIKSYELISMSLFSERVWRNKKRPTKR